MREIARRGALRGLLISAHVLSYLAAFKFAGWVALQLFPSIRPQVYLNLH